MRLLNVYKGPKRAFWGVNDVVKYLFSKKLSSSSCHVLVACMPKSGSTYLSAIIANLPKFQKVTLSRRYGSKEQDLELINLLLNHSVDYVAQHHIRFSEQTNKYMNDFHIKSIVLVRNLFDSVVSVRDHFRNEGYVGPMASSYSYMLEWNNDKLDEYIIHMIIPWYFNFYLGWQRCPHKLLVRYESINENIFDVLLSIRNNLCIDCTENDILKAIDEAESAFTRKNKAILGRGKEISLKNKRIINKMASFYSKHDLSLIME